jgi:hypothetical protein
MRTVNAGIPSGIAARLVWQVRRQVALTSALAVIAALALPGSASAASRVAESQGEIIASDVGLWQITHMHAYLDAATQLARASIQAFSPQYGGYGGQQPAYGAIFFRDLAELYAVAPDPLYAQEADAYRAWLGGFPMPSVPCPRGLCIVGGEYAHLWPMSQLVWGRLAQLRWPTRGQVRAVLSPLSYYWDARRHSYDATIGPRRHPYGERYFDDNAWVGLDYMKGYALTHDATLLKAARQAMAFVESGWTGAGERWGILSWNSNVSTIAAAAGAHLGIVLYRATGQGGYLVWAKRALAWLNSTLRGPDGVYVDSNTGVFPNGVPNDPVIELAAPIEMGAIGL